MPALTLFKPLLSLSDFLHSGAPVGCLLSRLKDVELKCFITELFKCFIFYEKFVLFLVAWNDLAQNVIVFRMQSKIKINFVFKHNGITHSAKVQKYEQGKILNRSPIFWHVVLII